MGKTLLTRLAAVAAGGVLAAAAAAPAFADSHTVHTLQPSHESTFADEHSQECAEGTAPVDERMAEKADDEDGWHFVVAGGTFISLTVIFAPGGDPDDAEDLVEITGSPADQDSPIVFYTAGPLTPHAYVFVPAGWLLVTATAEADGGQKLVVSHTCAGEPGDNGDKEPENGDKEPENGDKEPENGDETENGEDTEDGLPVTGSPASRLVALGAGLLTAGAAMAAGVAMLAVRRRRRLADLADS